MAQKSKKRPPGIGPGRIKPIDHSNEVPEQGSFYKVSVVCPGCYRRFNVKVENFKTGDLVKIPFHYMWPYAKIACWGRFKWERGWKQ